MDFIFASTNQGKAREVRALLGDSHTVRTLSDIGFTDEIIEDGNSFVENATIKAMAVHSWLLGKAGYGYDYILADDSGLEIDALSGKPGVETALWFGADLPYQEKVQLALKMLADVPEGERTARFVCVIACVKNKGQLETSRGILEGRIGHKAAGREGFGYDPIFVVPAQGCALAELSSEEKNLISHRARALRGLCSILGVDHS